MAHDLVWLHYWNIVSVMVALAHGRVYRDLYVVISDDVNIREVEAMRLIRKGIRDKKTMPVDVIVGKKDRFNQLKSTPSIERQIVMEGRIV